MSWYLGFSHSTNLKILPVILLLYLDNHSRSHASVFHIALGHSPISQPRMLP